MYHVLRIDREGNIEQAIATRIYSLNDASAILEKERKGCDDPCSIIIATNNTKPYEVVEVAVQAA